MGKRKGREASFLEGKCSEKVCLFMWRKSQKKLLIKKKQRSGYLRRLRMILGQWSLWPRPGYSSYMHKDQQVRGNILLPFLF